MAYKLYRFFTFIFFTLFSLFVVISLIGIMSLPPAHKMHTKIDQYLNAKNYISYEKMPKHLIDSIIAVEDKRFHGHFGIDPIGIIRAFQYNLKAEERAQGASTITQQVARNLFLNQEKTYTRKFREIFISFWIESHYSKEDILTAYLHSVYFGEDCFGIKCAVKTYFYKSPKKLKPVQSAMLAGLLKAPNYYSPFKSKRRSWQRTKRVLSILHEQKKITDKEYKEYLRLKHHLP